MKLISFIKKHYLGIIMVVCGILGTVAAFNLLVDRIEFYKNPNFVPPCSINVWLDCGVVMKSKWAQLFGFPNTILGLMFYPIGALTGLMLIANIKNSRWFMWFCTILAGLGVITNITLLYISDYIIGALCPWCILAGIATSNVFFSLVTYMLREGMVFNDKTRSELWQKRIRKGYDVLFVIGYYVAMFALAYLAFVLRKGGIDTAKFIDPVFWLWNVKS